MRHGETYFNVWHKIQGWCDSPLTPNGKKQAHAARQYFLEHNINFNKAYCSTAERASDTLEIITNHNMPYKRLKGLKEWGFGSFEAQDERLNPEPPYHDFFVQYGGEDQKAVQDRMMKTLAKIMAKTDDQDQILAVSHAGACFNFLMATGVDPQTALKQRFGNCSIMIFNYQNGKFKLDKIVNPN